MPAYRTRKIWSREEELQLVRLCKAKHCCADIAEIMGRTKPSIYDKTQKLGVKIYYPKGGHNGKGPSLPADVVRVIKAMTDAGISVNDIITVLRGEYSVSGSYIRGIRRGEYGNGQK